MAFVSAETFAISRVPGADDVVFGYRKEEVAFFGESGSCMLVEMPCEWVSESSDRLLHLCERPLVT